MAIWRGRGNENLSTLWIYFEDRANHIFWQIKCQKKRRVKKSQAEPQVVLA